MKRILLAAAVLCGMAWSTMAGAASVAGSANVEERSGFYYNAKTGAKTNSAGDQTFVDADRPEDRGSLTNLLVATVVGKAVATTNVIDASQYTSFQVHVSWTVTDSANADSVALLLVPYGRTTITDSGDNYIITQARAVGALSAGPDSCLWQLNRTLPGILVTSRGSLYGSNVVWSGEIRRPERVVWTDFGMRTGTVFGRMFSNLHNIEKSYVLTKKVSFPLGGAPYGGDVKEPFLGFYVLNLSGITANDVAIDVIPKVN